MSEKLCLQWNDFHENIKSAFENLKQDIDFKDVTLVCEDGQQVEAHKVILASSSPFFLKLLARNKHHHVIQPNQLNLENDGTALFPRPMSVCRLREAAFTAPNCSCSS